MTYTVAFEINQKIVQQCTIDPASPSTARCAFQFPGTNLTGVCVITPTAEGDDLLAAQIGVVAHTAETPEVAKVAHSKSAPEAIGALASLPGLTAGAASQAPAGKATIHLGYVEKEGAPLYSVICPATFGKQ